jgi:hypothetical protein
MVSAAPERVSSPSASFAGFRSVSPSMVTAKIVLRTATFCAAVMVKVGLWPSQVSTTDFVNPAESMRASSRLGRRCRLCLRRQSRHRPGRSPLWTITGTRDRRSTEFALLARLGEFRALLRARTGSEPVIFSDGLRMIAPW